MCVCEYKYINPETWQQDGGQCRAGRRRNPRGASSEVHHSIQRRAIKILNLNMERGDGRLLRGAGGSQVRHQPSVARDSISPPT